MKYKIVNFDRTMGFITVLFNDITNYKLTLMVPIIDDKYITGDELHSFIQSFEAQENDVRKLEIEAVSNESELLNMVDIDGMKMYIREQRNILLAESDYTQIPDIPLSLELRGKWKEYRQQLRDITKQDDFPLNISWPIKPF